MNMDVNNPITSKIVHTKIVEQINHKNKMKKQLKLLMIISLLTLFTSCNNKTKEAQLAIEKYCTLNAKVHNAAAGTEQEAATAEKKAFEKEVDDKYFKDYKTYQFILEGMKKCDETFAGNMQTSSSSESNAGTSLPSAYGNAATVAKNYCDLVDMSISLSKTGTDAELRTIIATKLIFEKNMDESYKNNQQRRDSIFVLIKPCMQKEISFKAGK